MANSLEQIMQERRQAPEVQDIRDRLLEYNTTMLVAISAQLGVTETETVASNAMDLVWKLREKTGRNVAGVRPF